MQLSIRDASRFVIGAAIIRDIAITNSPGSGVTFDNVSAGAMRDGPDGQDLRASIEKLADQEGSWFKAKSSHTLVSTRVLETRAKEASTLNNVALAALATLAYEADARQGDGIALGVVQERYRAAVQSIDEMPGSTLERRALFAALEEQTVGATSDPEFVTKQIALAKKTYLAEMFQETMAVYQQPALERSDDLDLGM